MLFGTGDKTMKSVSNCSENKDSHMEWSGDWTSTSPSNSNLSVGKLRLGGVRLLCSISEDGGVVVFLDSDMEMDMVVDSFGDGGLRSEVHEISLLIDPILPQREFIIITMINFLLPNTNNVT